MTVIRQYIPLAGLAFLVACSAGNTTTPTSGNSSTVLLNGLAAPSLNYTTIITTIFANQPPPLTGYGECSRAYTNPALLTPPPAKCTVDAGLSHLELLP